MKNFIQNSANWSFGSGNLTLNLFTLISYYILLMIQCLWLEYLRPFLSNTETKSYYKKNDSCKIKPMEKYRRLLIFIVLFTIFIDALLIHLVSWFEILQLVADEMLQILPWWYCWENEILSEIHNWKKNCCENVFTFIVRQKS